MPNLDDLEKQNIPLTSPKDSSSRYADIESVPEVSALLNNDVPIRNTGVLSNAAAKRQSLFKLDEPIVDEQANDFMHDVGRKLNKTRPATFIKEVDNKSFIAVLFLCMGIVLLLILAYKFGNVNANNDKLNVAILAMMLIDVILQFVLNYYESSFFDAELMSSSYSEACLLISILISFVLLLYCASAANSNIIWDILELIRTILKIIITTFTLRLVSSNFINIKRIFKDITIRETEVESLQDRFDQIQMKRKKFKQHTGGLNRIRFCEFLSMLINIITVSTTFSFIYFSHWSCENKSILLFNVVQMTFVVFSTSSKSLYYNEHVHQLEQDLTWKAHLTISFGGYKPNNEILIVPLISLVTVAVEALIGQHS